MRLNQEGDGGTNDVLADESRISRFNREGDAVSLEGSTRSYLIREDACSTTGEGGVTSTQPGGLGNTTVFPFEVGFRRFLALVNLAKKDGDFPIVDVTLEYTANAFVNDFKRSKTLTGSTADDG